MFKKVRVLSGKYRTRSSVDPETGNRIKKLIVYRAGEIFYTYESIPKAFQNTLKVEEEWKVFVANDSVVENNDTGEDTSDNENAADVNDFEAETGEDVPEEVPVIDEEGNELDTTDIGNETDVVVEVPEPVLVSEAPVETSTATEEKIEEVAAEAKPFRRTKKTKPA